MVVIVLILAAIAVPYYAHLRTGKGVIELFWSLPAPWPSFLLTLAGVLALCVVMLVAGALLWNDAPFRAVQMDGVMHLVERVRFNVLAGLSSAALASTLVVFGAIGTGWFWILVTVVGLLLLATAAFLVTLRTTWILTPGEIARTESVFGQPRTTWAVPEEPVFGQTETATGGAFGQPRIVSYQVRLGEVTLLECNDKARTDALLAALELAYPPRVAKEQAAAP